MDNSWPCSTSALYLRPLAKVLCENERGAHCLSWLNMKHLMTGPEGNSELCFARISMFPETMFRGNIEIQGK